MKYRYAMVCSSNQNRSMEAHFLLKRQGFDVSSYSTGQHVKLRGPSLREPNVYDFGSPYKHMLDELRRKDPELPHGQHAVAQWDEEFQSICNLNAYKDNVFHPWEIAFTVFNEMLLVLETKEIMINFRS